MEIRFYKYHGTGNDFILIDLREQEFDPGQEMVSWLCDRRFGIGADGMILLKNSPGYDFKMIYYNSDGLESTMCGNGGRCVVSFADFLSPKTGNVRFIARDGGHEGLILNRQGSCHKVRLQMNNVRHIKQWGKDFILDTGSPHLVRFVPDTESIDVKKQGRDLRNHIDFQPGGTNVNFVKISGDSLYVRTYERGVEDETLSCGTGVTASALAHAMMNEMKAGVIQVATPGGMLKVHFRKDNEGFTDIWLEGSAVRVFEGKIDI